MNIDVKKILDQAKESYDRYFKDAPVLPDNHGQDVIIDKDKMLEIIKKKQAGGGRSNQETPTKNDRKHMRKGPKIYNK